MNTPARRRTSSYNTLRQEMDRLFTDFFPSTSEGDPTWAPRTDVVETDDAYHLSMDLPGVDAEGVDVHFDDGMLRGSGQREVRADHREGRFHRVERSYGHFLRSFRLGNDIDTDGIDASYDRGVLTVRVPKTEARKPRQISVRTQAAVTSGAETASDRVEENGTTVEV